MRTEKVTKQKKEKSPFFCYKGKPLIRLKDTLYYGNIEDGCVVKMRVKNSSLVKDLKVSGSISVQMIDTDPETPAEEKIVKFSEKQGLYQALDVAEAWLEKYYEIQSDL